MNVRLCLLAAAQLLALALHASPPAELAAVYAETLRPYAGPVVRGVDASTLTGRVMCGYQGWFNAEGDGANRGYHHWAKGSARPAPGNLTVEMWPDLSGFAAEERFPTDLKHADGRTAEVFSSFRKPTVLRHFEWMREYGIDGVFVQRFAGPLRDSRHLRANNVVLDHCREGANRSGRAYAVMYDLSGLGTGRVAGVAADWNELRTKMRITEDAAYLRHRGKPLVAIWGVGFYDDRRYTVAECRELVELLKKDGCSVMLGVPTGWRELHRDAVKDPALHDVLKLADVVSPWTVGRYRTPAEAARHGARVVEPDIAWCRENGPDYMPVAFPGFSWANLKRDASNAIPRLKGEFLWSQFVAAKKAGATSLYVAMFDEVDEGTAIFKCTNDVPVSPQDQFATYEGLPSDFYLNTHRTRRAPAPRRNPDRQRPVTRRHGEFASVLDLAGMVLPASGIMKVPYYQVDAFTDRVFSGNPAGVCILDRWLRDSLLQQVAAENNLSETAFVVRAGDAFELRWFTPDQEVDLCGHATLATSFVLFTELGHTGGTVKFESKSGPLGATFDGKVVMLDFPSRPGEPSPAPPALYSGLGQVPREVRRNRDYLAVVGDEDEVRALTPDFPQLATLDSLGVIVTAPGREFDFVSRFFAPSVGIPEDPVTGSAHCTLIPYWAEKLGKTKMVARQLSKRGGTIHCELRGDRVGMGGSAALYSRAELLLPD